MDTFAHYDPSLAAFHGFVGVGSLKGEGSRFNAEAQFLRDSQNDHSIRRRRVVHRGPTETSEAKVPATPETVAELETTPLSFALPPAIPDPNRIHFCSTAAARETHIIIHLGRGAHHRRVLGYQEPRITERQCEALVPRRNRRGGKICGRRR